MRARSMRCAKALPRGGGALALGLRVTVGVTAAPHRDTNAMCQAWCTGVIIGVLLLAGRWHKRCIRVWHERRCGGGCEILDHFTAPILSQSSPL